MREVKLHNSTQKIDLGRRKEIWIYRSSIVFHSLVLLLLFIAFAQVSLGDVVINRGEVVTLNEGEYLSIEDLVIYGTLDASGIDSEIDLYASWRNKGEYVPGRLVLKGTGPWNFSGNSSFREFIAQSISGSISFESGSTQSFLGPVALAGKDSYHLLHVSSSEAGKPFNLDLVSGSIGVYYLSVSNANLKNNAIYPNFSYDNGNNSDLWYFKGADIDQDGLDTLTEVNLGLNPNLADSDYDGVNDSIELAQGSNPLDRSSHGNPASSVTCSQWSNVIPGSINILELGNFANLKVTSETRIYDYSGKLLRKIRTKLFPKSQVDIIIQDLVGNDSTMSGLACTNLGKNSSSAIARMVYYKLAQGNTGEVSHAVVVDNGDFGSIGEQSVGFNTYFPSKSPEELDALTANWVSIMNVGSTIESGFLTSYDQNGVLLKRKKISLQPFSFTDSPSHDFGPNQVGYVLWTPVSKKALFKLSSQRYFYKAKAYYPQNITDLVTFSGFNPRSGPVGFYIDTSSGATVLEVSNVLNTRNKIQIEAFNIDGQKIASKTVPIAGSKTIHLFVNQLVPSHEGTIILRSTKMSSFTASLAHYEYDDSKLFSSSSSSDPFQFIGKQLNGTYNSHLAQDCKLVLVNGSDSTVQADLIIYSPQVDRAGTVLESSKLSVTPRATKIVDLCARVPPESHGIIEVHSSAPGSLAGLVERIGSKQNYKFDTYLIPDGTAAK